MFEQLYKVKFLKSNPGYAFLLGFAYCIIGIFSAKLIFGSNPGMMSFAFTAMLLVPSLNNLLSISEKSETREKKFSFKLLFKNHWDIFSIYFLAFMGIFCAYLLFTIVWSPDFSTEYLEPQLAVVGISADTVGMAAYSPEFADFLGILSNNIVVMIATLFLSFFYGAGSILFIAWNASVWGSVFGYRIKESIMYSSQNWWPAFYMTILPVLPHMFTESISYFSAAIVGGVVSKAFLSERFGSKRFRRVIDDALIFFIMALALIIIAAYLEVYILPRLFFFVLGI